MNETGESSGIQSGTPLVAIAPPEYFPSVRLAALMVVVDVLVLADTYQYVRQSYQNRARIRTPDGTQWLTVPIQGGQHGRSIDAVCIDAESGWRGKHERALQFNYGGTPFFDHYIDAIRGLISAPHTRLAEVTTPSSRWIAQAVGAGAEISIASTLPGRPVTRDQIVAAFPGHSLVVPSWSISGRSAPDEARALADGNARADAGPPAEAHAPAEARAHAAAYAHAVFEFTPGAYRQPFDGFVPQCSVLDLLMMTGPEAESLLRSCSTITTVAES